MNKMREAKVVMVVKIEEKMGVMRSKIFDDDVSFMACYKEFSRALDVEVPWVSGVEALTLRFFLMFQISPFA